MCSPGSGGSHWLYTSLAELLWTLAMLHQSRQEGRLSIRCVLDRNVCLGWWLVYPILRGAATQVARNTEGLKPVWGWGMLIYNIKYDSCVSVWAILIKLKPHSLRPKKKSCMVLGCFGLFIIRALIRRLQKNCKIKVIHLITRGKNPSLSKKRNKD